MIPAGQHGPSRSFDGRAVLLASGLMLMLACFGLGLGHSRLSRGRWPGVALDPLADANASLARGRIRDAAREYRMAARLTPADFVAQAQLADIARTIGDTTEEVAACAALARLRPGPAVDARLGDALLRAGRAEEAVGPLRRAAAARPRDGDAHNALGVACVHAGRLDEAVREFEEAVRLGVPPSARENLERARALRAAPKGP
jgi:Flp pilus assembly protein TadD